MNWFRLGWLLAIVCAISASLLYARYTVGYLDSNLAGFLVIFSVFTTGVMFPLIWTTAKYYRRTEDDLAGRGLFNILVFGVLMALGVAVLSNLVILGKNVVALIFLVVAFVAVLFARRG